MAKTLLENAMIRPPSATCCADCERTRKGSAEVGGNDFVEGLHITFGDGRKRHDACVVDHDVDLSESLEGLLEELLDVFGIRNISLDCKGASAGAGDLVDYLFCFGCIAGIVDDDAESVGCEAKGDGTSDAAGCSGYDCCLSHAGSPFGGFFELEVRRQKHLRPWLILMPAGSRLRTHKDTEYYSET